MVINKISNKIFNLIKEIYYTVRYNYRRVFPRDHIMTLILFFYSETYLLGRLYDLATIALTPLAIRSSAILALLVAPAHALASPATRHGLHSVPAMHQVGVNNLGVHGGCRGNHDAVFLFVRIGCSVRDMVGFLFHLKGLIMDNAFLK